MRSPIPIFAFVALALFMVIGIVAFGASMSSMDTETNGTATDQTIEAYQISYGWWLGMGLLVLVLAIGFVFWRYWG